MDLKSGMELNVQTERAHILYVSWQEGLVWASDRNGKIKIRELDTGSVRFTLAEHYQRVNALAFTPDKQRALTCSYDGTVKVWETTNWQLIASLEGHSAGVTSLVVTPDGKFAVSGGDEPDNSLVVWDLVNYRAHKTLSGHTGKIVNCVFTPDGQRMISTSENEYIVWELPGFRKLYDHEGWLVMLSPDGRYLLSQPDVRTIDVSLAENGERVFCTEYAEKRMDSIKVTSDSRYVVIGMSAGIIGSTYVLNINDGEEVTHFWGEFLAMAPDDKSVIVVGDRFVLNLINLQSGKVINTFAGHTSRLTSATFTDEGRKLVSTCTDQTLKVWDVARKGESIEIAGHAYWINAISVHGRRAITGCRDGSFKLWNLDTTEVDFSQQYDARGVDAIQWSADGRRTAIVYSDDIRIWDMNKREVVFTLNAASAMNLGIRSFRMSPDGRRAISHVDCMLHTELVAWDLEAGSELTRFKLEMGQSGEIAISPDGRWAAVGAYPSTLLWNLESGTCQKMEGHGRSITAITFSPDGRLLASAAEDGSIKIHTVETQSLLGSLSGHTDKVNDILFKDKDTLFSASKDGTIRSWDIPTQKTIFAFTSRDEPKHISHSAQKNWLLSRSRDSLCLWDLNTGQNLGSFIDDSELFAMGTADVVLCGGKSGGFHILKVIPPKLIETAPAPVQVEEKIKQSPVPVVEEARLPAPDPAELEKLGKSCLDTGKYGQALHYFDDALALKPNDTNLLFYRATTLTRSGKYEEGIVQLDYIIANNLAPGLNLGYAYLGKANLLVSLKRYEESLEWYQKAIKIVNNVRVFWYMQGYALYCLSRFDEALPSLQKAEEMSSDETTREFIGWCQLGVRKFEEAWVTFSKLTAQPPRDILSWYGMGLACKALGKKEQAREALKKFLESTRPEHAPHLSRAKQILQELNV